MTWLADGRHKSEWTRTASLAASFHATHTGQKIDPVTLIPERYRPDRPPEPALTPEQQAVESKIAFDALRWGLSQMNRQMGK